MEVFLLFNGIGAFLGITIATLVAIPLAIIWRISEKNGESVVEQRAMTIDELIREVNSDYKANRRQC